MKLLTVSFISFLSLSTMAASTQTDDNLMPEVTHSSESLKTYSAPQASVGYHREVKALKELQKDEKALHASKINRDQTLHHN